MTPTTCFCTLHVSLEHYLFGRLACYSTDHSTLSCNYLVLFHTSGYINLYPLISIYMAYSQAKSNIKKSGRQRLVLQYQGGVLGVCNGCLS